MRGTLGSLGAPGSFDIWRIFYFIIRVIYWRQRSLQSVKERRRGKTCKRVYGAVLL